MASVKLVTGGSINFDEYNGSPKFSGTINELTGTREGEILWAERDAAYLELFPLAVAGIPSFPALCPGSAFLRASSIKIEPVFEDALITDTASGINGYERAKILIEYKSLQWDYSNPADPSSSQLISRRNTVGGEMLTLPNTSLAWKDNKRVITNPEAKNGMLLGTVDHEITLHRVPLAYIPYGAIRSLVSTVNSAAWEGAATGCVLFLGADIRRQYATNGDVEAEVTLKFKERAVNPVSGVTVTWNHVFDTDTGRWREICLNDSAAGYPAMHKSSNFNLLF